MSFVTLKFNPDQRTLRQFGFIAFFFFVSLGVLIYLGLVAENWNRGTRTGVGVGFATIGLLSGLFSLFQASFNRPLYVGMSLIAYPIGTVVSYVVLASVFFLVIGPVALVQKLLGRDALALRDRKEPSHWRKPDGPKSDASYFQQF